MANLKLKMKNVCSLEKALLIENDKWRKQLRSDRSLWSNSKFLGNEILIDPAWICYLPLTQSAMVMVNMTVFVNGERVNS